MLRIPTGYWNWIVLGEDKIEAPSDVLTRLDRMTNVSPEEYKPYIDKLYTWGKKYGIQILTSMHGLPGS